MGQFDFNADVDFVKQLESFENYDKIAEEVLKETAPTLIKYVSRAYTNTISKEVGDSVEIATLDKGKYGWYVSIRATGKNKGGHWKYTNDQATKRKIKSAKRVPLSNMDLVAFFEFGTSTMYPMPTTQTALRDASDEIEDKLQESFNKAVNLK